MTFVKLNSETTAHYVAYDMVRGMFNGHILSSRFLVHYYRAEFLHMLNPISFVVEGTLIMGLDFYQH